MAGKKRNGTNKNTGYEYIINVLNKDVGEYLADRHNRRVVAGISLSCALFAGLLIIFNLILPATALTGDYELSCAYAVHQHDDSCYGQVAVYDKNGELTGTEEGLVCGLADYVVHEHNQDCYDGEGNLVCPLPEIEEHHHTKECYEEEQVLVCGLEESEPDENGEGGHIHDDSCYETREIVTCGQQELHTHDKGCYDESGNLTCGLLELEEHVHGDECFVEKEEPQETDTEVADDSSVALNDDAAITDESNEGSSVSQDILPDDETTGESSSESDTGLNSENDNEPENESDTESMDTDDPADSSLTFTEKAGEITVTVIASEKAFPTGTVMKVSPVEKKTVSDSVDELISKKIKDIEAVDISFYDKDGNEIEPKEAIQVTIQSDKIADDSGPLVVHVDDKGAAEVVEQIDTTNTDQLISEDEVVFTSDSFSTYALVYTLDFYEGDLECQKKTFKITATFDEKAEIPTGTELHAEEIKKDTEEYKECLKRAESALKEDTPEITDLSETDASSFGTLTPLAAEQSSRIGFARFFDISFISDGKKIEPLAPVEVTIEYVDNVSVSEEGTPKVIHFASDGVELIDPDISLSGQGTNVENTSADKSEKEIDTFTFTQSSFSITGTIIQLNIATDEVIPEGDYVIATKKSVTQSDGSFKNYWDILSGNANNNTIETQEVYTADSNNMSLGKYLSLYGDNNCIWTITRSGDKYIIKNKANGKKYVALTGEKNKNENVVVEYWVSQPPALTITHSGKNFQISNNGKYLGILGNDKRYFVHKESSTNVNLFRINAPQETSGTGYDPKALDVDFLKEWEDTLLNSKALHNTSKTAEVYDYDNRIYQVDLTADSGMLAMNESLDLAFITDISNSMLFSSSLQDTGKKFRFSWNSNGTKNVNLNEAFPDENQVYIIIGDPHRESCHYAVWYERNGWWDPRTNSWYGQNQWLCLDASYYSKWKYDVLTHGNANDYYSKYVYNQKTVRLPDVLQYNDPDSSKFSPNQDHPVYLPSDTWLEGFGDIYSNSGQNAGNRLYYIKKSIKDAISSMQTVSKADDNQQIRVALETFCKGVPEAHGTSEPEYVAGTAGVDFTDISNASALNNHVTAITTDDGTDQRNALAKFNTGFATYEYAKNWSTGDGKKKIVIVISDGSPNEKGSTKSTPETVRNAAAALEAKGATVISIALSMKDVEYGKSIMYNIATADENGSRSENYYQAENENELAYIFYDILRKLIAEATVVGKVEDTIDEAFYPVDKKGDPLPDGTYIDLKGNVIAKPVGPNRYVDGSGNTIYTQNGWFWISDELGWQQLPFNNMAGIGKLTKTDDNWKVEWNNENINWPGSPAETNPGWHGTIYVKAKEDFLGANTVNTNKGNALITPDSYYITTNAGAAYLPIPVNKKNTAELPTPHVNIDELSFTDAETSWKVYLDTQVDPSDQIRNLLDNIQVNEVVSKTVDGNDPDNQPDHIIRDTNGGLLKFDPSKSNPSQWAGEPTNNGVPTNGRNPVQNFTPEQFTLLWTLEKNCGGSLTTEEIKTLLDGGTISRNYGEYGHANVGTITISLNKKCESHPANSGQDQTVDDYREEYVLTAKYTPKTIDERKSQLHISDDNYHTGKWGTKKPGAATGFIESENKHIITIFQKGLQILKVDQLGNPITSSPAEFTLYREARPEEISDDSIEKKTGEQLHLIGTLKEKMFVAVGSSSTRQTNSQTGESAVTGLARWNPIYPAKNEGAADYYSADSAYYKDNTEFYLVEDVAPNGYRTLPGPVKVTLTLAEDRGDNKADVGGVSLYDRWQSARISVTGTEETMNYVPQIANGSEGDSLDSEIRFATFRIMNTQGYELPATGGMGTEKLYLLGIMLLTSAGLILAFKKKREGADY